MKKIILIMIAMVFFFSSCELDRDPYNYMTDDQLKGNPKQNLPALVEGCYGTMKAWIERPYQLGEYGGDNVNKHANSTNNFMDHINYTPSTTNKHAKFMWDNGYSIIAQASDLIKNNSEGQNVETDKLLGELHYLRGLVYYYLAQFFGRPYYQSPETNLAVPLVNGTDVDINKLPDRATVKEVYEQVIADLEAADRLLAKSGFESSIKASSLSAKALLSRVYLYMSGTYENPNATYAQKAIDYATEVINSGQFQLLERRNFVIYPTFAPESKIQTETIFAIKRVSTEFPNGDFSGLLGSMYAKIQGQGWGEMFATESLLDLLRASAPNKADARWEFIKPQYELDKNGKMTPCFRYVTKGTTGYNYVQTSVIQKGSDYYATIDKQDYKLTISDPGNNMYTVSVNGQTYRGELDYLMKTNNGYPMYYIYKISLQEGYTHLWSPIVSRLGEVYLNRAEAYVKLGKYSDAQHDINLIRGRSVVGGEYPSGYMKAENASQVVDDERRLEMAFEGFRSFDIFRLGHTLVRNYPGFFGGENKPIEATDLRIPQAVPQTAIDAYLPSKLTQNPY